MSSRTTAKRSEKTKVSDNTSESTRPSVGSSAKESPSSISSPPSKLSAIAKFFTSPQRTEKSKQTKKSKTSTKGKKKSKNVESRVEENDSENTTTVVENENLLCESGVQARGDTSSVVTSSRTGDVEEGEREDEPSTPDRTNVKDNSKRPMVQANLATGKDGIEVISSPEQQEEIKKKGKKTSSKRKESHEKGKKQTRITSIFPARKSNRKCKSEQEKDEQARISKAILSKIFEGLEVRTIEEKGRGVFASRDFARHEFVCEYTGELISSDEATKRELVYAEDKNIGCYMYYLPHNNKKYCVDATAEDGTYGRLLNHSKRGNCKTKTHVIEDIPHLIFVTKCDIKQGEELTYDYGDRSRDAVESHPWLKY